jgi:hypothetical protein
MLSLLCLGATAFEELEPMTDLQRRMFGNMEYDDMDVMDDDDESFDMMMDDEDDDDDMDDIDMDMLMDEMMSGDMDEDFMDLFPGDWKEKFAEWKKKSDALLAKAKAKAAKWWEKIKGGNIGIPGLGSFGRRMQYELDDMMMDSMDDEDFEDMDMDDMDMMMESMDMEDDDMDEDFMDIFNKDKIKEKLASWKAKFQTWKQKQAARIARWKKKAAALKAAAKKRMADLWKKLMGRRRTEMLRDVLRRME